MPQRSKTIWCDDTKMKTFCYLSSDVTLLNDRVCRNRGCFAAIKCYKKARFLKKCGKNFFSKMQKKIYIYKKIERKKNSEITYPIVAKYRWKWNSINCYRNRRWETKSIPVPAILWQTPPLRSIETSSSDKRMTVTLFVLVEIFRETEILAARDY